MKRRRFSWLQLGAYTCLLSAVLLGAWVAWLEFGTNMMADAARNDLIEEFEAGAFTVERPVSALADGEPVPGSVSGSEVPTVDFQYGEVFGKLYVPRFGDEYVEPMLEGTDTAALKVGVGHYTGTASPCQVGNFAIAAHRTTYGAAFRNIEKLQVGDEITVETHYVSCTYEVERSVIVSPSDWEVTAPVPGDPEATPTEAYLTMTTCHPLYSAAERYVVHARLIEETVEF